jgi:hypothetical protein
MKEKAQELIKNMLGDSFIEDLAKFEMVNLKTNTAISHEEIADAFKVVPRAVMSWLISTLSGLPEGDTKEVILPFGKASGAKMNVNKKASDVYSGEIFKDGKIINRFQYRSIPGIGLVLLTTFELYDIDNLIDNKQISEPIVAQKPEIKPEIAINNNFSSLYGAIGQIIEEKLALRDLIEKVVDKKIDQKQAVQDLFLIRMANEIKAFSSIPKKEESKEVKKEDKKPEKITKLKKFLDKKKNKTFNLKKSENVFCPDCTKEILNEKGFVGCVCFGNNRKSQINLIKTENGIKMSFSKDWEPENIEMLLSILQKRRLS